MKTRILKITDKLYLSLSVVVLIGFAFSGYTNISKEVRKNNQFNKAHESLEKTTNVIKLVHSPKLSLSENRELVSLMSDARWYGKGENKPNVSLDVTKPEFDPSKPFEVVSRNSKPTVGQTESGHSFKGGDPSKKENWLRVGTVDDGFIFQGGDPSKEESWKKVVPVFNPDLYLIDKECFDLVGNPVVYKSGYNRFELAKMSDNQLHEEYLKSVSAKKDCYYIKDFGPGNISTSIFMALGYFLLSILSLYLLRRWTLWVFQ